MARFADSGTSLAHAAFLLQLHPIARIFVERGEPQGAAVKKITVERRHQMEAASSRVRARRAAACLESGEPLRGCDPEGHGKNAPAWLLLIDRQPKRVVVAP